MTDCAQQSDCYCSIAVGIRNILHTDSLLASRLAYSQDLSSNHFWDEGSIPVNAPPPYASVRTLGRFNIQHNSDGMIAPETVRIRVYDTKDAIGLALRITKILRTKCICVGTSAKTNNCCFKLVASQETTLGLAILAELTFNTLWSAPHIF
jgi:hypothetical protein